REERLRLDRAGAPGRRRGRPSGVTTMEQAAGTAQSDRERYLAEFARLAKEQPSFRRSWTFRTRQDALSRFEEIGFPTLQDEEWRKTSVAPILQVRFRPQQPPVTNGLTPPSNER